MKIIPKMKTRSSKNFDDHIWSVCDFILLLICLKHRCFGSINPCDQWDSLSLLLVEILFVNTNLRQNLS